MLAHFCKGWLAERASQVGNRVADPEDLRGATEGCPLWPTKEVREHVTVDMPQQQGAREQSTWCREKWDVVGGEKSRQVSERHARGLQAVSPNGTRA